jgi:CRISPR-associated protein Cmr5
MRTIGQERASYALEKVLNLKCDRTDFKSFSAGVPSMILQNGFGQVLAFLLAKGTDKELKLKENDKHIVMFNIIREWLVNKGFAKGENEKDFIIRLNEMSQQEYLTAQEEALKLLEWVKRYANADFGGE